MWSPIPIILAFCIEIKIKYLTPTIKLSINMSLESRGYGGDDIKGKKWNNARKTSYLFFNVQFDFISP